jgi:hypothetical protein
VILLLCIASRHLWWQIPQGRDAGRLPVILPTKFELAGNPDTHWVRVTVEPSDPQLFTFKGEIIPENVVNRGAK